VLVPISCAKFLASLLLGLSLLSDPHDGQVPLNSSMELTCTPPLGLALHLQTGKIGETLVVHIMMAEMSMRGVKNTPHPAKGQWCSAENHCESVQTTVRFKKFDVKRRGSGTYEVEFGDGHKRQGSFSAVRSPQPEPFLCE
jgi:hypothetical protein